MSGLKLGFIYCFESEVRNFYVVSCVEADQPHKLKSRYFFIFLRILSFNENERRTACLSAN